MLRKGCLYMKKDNKQGNDQKAAEDGNMELLFSYFNEINIISQLSTGILEKKLPEGITASQFNVLNWFVRVDDSATPGRLSTAFQVTKGAMTNTLKKLEQKHLVTIEPDTTSGRRKIVKMTRQGHRVRQASIKSIFPVLAEFAIAVGSINIEKQVTELQKVRVHLDDYRFR